MMRFLFFLVALPALVLGQPLDTASSQVVSSSTDQQASNAVLKELHIGQFIEWVDHNHPLLKAVGNKLPTAKAELLKARGAFDPRWTGAYASKEYKGDMYYRLPAWALETDVRGPLSLSVDWNATAGLYTNPQDKLPEEGMFAVGGMLNLGNGLMTDQRRTDLRIARAGVELSEAEAELYRNELLLKASKAYWKWYAAHENLKAYESALQAASEVYAYTKESFQAGDASAMDTLDARALLMTWETDYQLARNKAIGALYEASTWLWNEAEEPMILNAETVPSGALLSWPIPLNLEAHPLVRYNDAKEEQLRAKRQLAREYLKPKVAVGGALLAPGNTELLPSSGDFTAENRVVKAKVELPLFLREGLGYSRSQNLQLETFEWERAQMEYELQRQWEAQGYQIRNLEEAMVASEKNEEVMAALLAGEREKLRLGDSELIKVNLRTSYYAKARIQRANIQSELGQAWARWAQLSAAF